MISISFLVEKGNSHSIDVRFTYRLLIEKEFISSNMDKINKNHGDSMISLRFLFRFETIWITFLTKRKF